MTETQQKIEAKRQCKECKRSFSEHLIQEHMTSKGVMKEICPLCALKERNLILHFREGKPYITEHAKELYNEAMEELAIILKQEEEDKNKKEQKKEIQSKGKIIKVDKKTK